MELPLLAGLSLRRASFDGRQYRRPQTRLERLTLCAGDRADVFGEWFPAGRFQNSFGAGSGDR